MITVVERLELKEKLELEACSTVDRIIAHHQAKWRPHASLLIELIKKLKN